MIMYSKASEDCTTLHHALRWDGRLVESQKGLETKAGLRADLEMPELISDDLVMGSELCPKSPTVALHVLSNSSVEAELMCLDSLRLPSCVQTLHVGSSINIVKAT
ncbi:hypothetical protein M9H77_26495 [Catharanthus roseus]|uniref:Uncharacterized protein n=1 Tax=Catharanthus roseus TaxID=4058 RepID=A0ACC0A9U2_CATRO|nr:hypothetical protein M9H77_26495 [Catharanthus roseus]